MLCLIRPKACKRCGGDLSLESDIYGVYIQCIQCGATLNEKDIAQSVYRKTLAQAKTDNVKTLAVAGKKNWPQT